MGREPRGTSRGRRGFGARNFAAKNGATEFHLENLVGSVTAVQVSQIFKLISWLSSHHVDGPGPLTI